MISEPLKIELSFDMYSQILREHPFFMELLQEYQPLRYYMLLLVNIVI